MTTDSFDVLVIGGGIAGVSLAYELAAHASVGLLEAEPTLAFHTTGRSAAVFIESLGSPVIRALTVASKSFLLDPPADFGEELATPLPVLTIASEGRGDVLRAYFDEVRDLVADVELIDGAEAERRNPLLRPGHVESAMYEHGAQLLDVHAIHQGYLRGFRERGGEVVVSAATVGARRVNGVWEVTTARGDVYRASVVVNAAGAWADRVSEQFGAKHVGLHPLRRTIFTVNPPAGVSASGVPMIADMDSSFYLKPEGDQFLCSPSEETPHEPGDVRPELEDIAMAIEAINDATVLSIRSVKTQWAGLRSFVADRNPVVGYDRQAEGFFWFAGQGGYGIQTAPALARVAANLFAEDDAAGGALVDIAALAPERAGIPDDLHHEG